MAWSLSRPIHPPTGPDWVSRDNFSDLGKMRSSMYQFALSWCNEDWTCLTLITFTWVWAKAWLTPKCSSWRPWGQLWPAGLMLLLAGPSSRSRSMSVHPCPPSKDPSGNLEERLAFGTGGKQRYATWNFSRVDLKSPSQRCVLFWCVWLKKINTE